MTERPTSPAGPYTWDDFVLLEEGDLRELIDGELVEVEVPTDIHEHIVTLLAYFLTAWSRPRQAGFALVSGFKVRISPRRGVMPDVQFYRKGNRSAERTPQGLVGGHPDLAVEVVSPGSGRYDRVTKLGYYASIGVPEYWLVDATLRTVERLVLAEGKYRIEEALEGDAVWRPASFPDLEIALGDLWTIPEV